jgi:hypothetical protein
MAAVSSSPFDLRTLVAGGYNPNYLAPAAAPTSQPAVKPAAVSAPAKGTPIYWVGADGHVYLKGTGGNTAAVSDLGLSSNVKQSQIGGAYQVDDPNAPKAPAATATGTGPVAADKSNDIAQQTAGLGSVDTYLASGNAAVDASLAKLNGTYDTEAGAEKASYDTNTGQNKVNLSKNQQTALVNAAQGRRGLNGTLASIGALNGSGIELATRAVQKGANDDLAGASDSYATNAHALDEADAAFRTQDAERRKAAADAAATAKTKVRNTGLQTRQGYYQNLSNDYAAQLDKGNAAKYSDLAASLFPEIAATSVPDTAPAYSAATYTAPALSSYLSGANTQVQTTPATAATGGIPGLVAGTVRKKATAAV